MHQEHIIHLVPLPLKNLMECKYYHLFHIYYSLLSIVEKMEQLIY